MLEFMKKNKAKVTCPHCGNDESYVFFTTNDEKTKVTSEYGRCTRCRHITYDLSFEVKDGKVVGLRDVNVTNVEENEKTVIYAEINY